ncbi:pteridine reductase [Candidatus Halobeggiatoa sp. HSG11]|nr:pteridine reductase [Candidatus Halobeggiatoa sp. HSG11]
MHSLFEKKLNNKVVLITGSSKRIGASIVRQLHAHGMKIVLHYHHSKVAAEALQTELNEQRADSVMLVSGNICDLTQLNKIVQQVIENYEHLDVLINNASSFYPTPVGQVKDSNWEELLGTNLKAPFFLCQAAAPYLKKTNGCIVNLADIHGLRPLKEHSVYSIAKAGLIMLTKTLANELGPQIRVNAIAPGAILWPDNDMDDTTKQQIIANTALQRHGDAQDIAKTVLFLVRDANYITGQIISVDGGRTLNQ